MSRDRFQRLKAHLRFEKSAARPAVDRTDGSYDRLWKIRRLLNAVQDRFQAMYSPGQCLSVDEMMIKARSTCVAAGVGSLECPAASLRLMF